MLAVSEAYQAELYAGGGGPKIMMESLGLKYRGSLKITVTEAGIVGVQIYINQNALSDGQEWAA